MGIVAVCALVFVNFVAEDPEVAGQVPAFSFIVAVLAACGAVLAAWSASRSLELVRATTRPFLNISTPSLGVVPPGDDASIDIIIRNTGNLPADEVSILADVFVQEDGGDREENLIVKVSEYLSICFPGEKIVLNHPVRGLFGGLEVNEVVMRVTVEYRHKHSQGKCTTSRRFSVFLMTPGGAGFRPRAGEDKWT